MTGARASLGDARARIAADGTTGPSEFRNPPVRGDDDALVPVFVATISRRPAEVAEAASAENAAAGAAAAGDLVTSGAVRLRRRDGGRAAAAGTSGAVGSRVTLVEREAVGSSELRAGNIGWASAATATVATSSTGAVSPLASVAVDCAGEGGIPPRSAPAFIPKSTATPSSMAEPGFIDAGFSWVGFQWKGPGIAVWAVGQVNAGSAPGIVETVGFPCPSCVTSVASAGPAGATVAAASIEPKAGVASELPGNVPNAASPSAPEASGVPAGTPGKIAKEGREKDIKWISLRGDGRLPHP